MRNLHGPDDRLAAFPPSPLHHRTHSVLRLDPYRPPQPVSPQAPRPLAVEQGPQGLLWGHDWVVLCLLVRYCPWAPSKVWALPLLFRLYRNRQGLTKGKVTKGKAKKGKVKRKKQPTDPNHRTRPELPRELITLLAGWFPTGSSGSPATAPTAARVCDRTCLAMSICSAVSSPRECCMHPPRRLRRRPRAAGRKKGERLGGMAEWAADASQPWQELFSTSSAWHATLQVKTRQALYYGAGKDRLLTVVLVRDVLGKRPDQMFYCTCLGWDGALFSPITPRGGRSRSLLRTASNCSGWKTRPIGCPRPYCGLPPWSLLLYSLVVAWYHPGHQWERFPDRPWYRRKKEPSFADMLSTLRRAAGKIVFAGALPEGTPTRKSVDWLIDFASRAG